MIEGIRSEYEVEIFKNNFNNFKIIAVHSTPKTRFKRLKKRMRPDDSLKNHNLSLEIRENLISELGMLYPLQII